MTEAKKSYSARREELNSPSTRFIDIRNLAHLTYKKDDGTELMSYEQTLDDRDKVRQTVLEYELAKGIITPDGTEGQIAPHPQAAQPQGESQMTMPFQPPQPQGYAPPPTNGSNGAQQYGQPPMQPPMPQGMMPPQQMMPAPMAPPIASPMQAAQAGAQVQQQMAPQQEAPAPTGRKRRTAVAPPPGGPPPAAAAPAPQGFMAPPGMPPAPQQQMQAPSSFAPPGQSFVPPGAPPPMQQPPQAPQGFAPVSFAPPPAPQAPTMQPQAAAVDLAPLMAKIDSLGQVANQLTELVTSQKATIENLSAQLVDVRRVGLEGLTCLWHMYLTNPQLAPGAAGKNTLPDFRQWLGQFVGPQ